MPLKDPGNRLQQATKSLLKFVFFAKGIATNGGVLSDRSEGEVQTGRVVAAVGNGTLRTPSPRSSLNVAKVFEFSG